MFAALMGMMMLGVGVGQLGAVGNIAGGILAGAAICGLPGWLGWLFSVRVTFLVGRGGVERRMRLLKGERRRRWKREEIRGVTLRMRGLGRGRVWVVGLFLNNGRRVAMAMGPQGTVEAFASLLERELGMGEREEVRGDAE